MWVLWQLIPKLPQAETRLFASILMIAALLLAFGLLAEEVIEGETLPFDRKLMLALREAGNPGVPIGPPLTEGTDEPATLCCDLRFRAE
jgi:undecaprenyl-diphosphatase